jgi:hypothetical protein
MPVIPTDPTSGAYKYSGLNTAGSALTCESYHLGAVMEDTSNQALNSDVDLSAAGSACTGSGAVFTGNATSCAGTTDVTPDPCYDVTP